MTDSYSIKHFYEIIFFLLFYLSGAPLLGRLLGLLPNIRLGWKDLPGANTLAYFEYLLIVAVKK